jgi:hypothetical protein
MAGTDEVLYCRAVTPVGEGSGRSRFGSVLPLRNNDVQSGLPSGDTSLRGAHEKSYLFVGCVRTWPADSVPGLDDVEVADTVETVVEEAGESMKESVAPPPADEGDVVVVKKTVSRVVGEDSLLLLLLLLLEMVKMMSSVEMDIRQFFVRKCAQFHTPLRATKKKQQQHTFSVRPSRSGQARPGQAPHTHARLSSPAPFFSSLIFY